MYVYNIYIYMYIYILLISQSLIRVFTLVYGIANEINLRFFFVHKKQIDCYFKAISCAPRDLFTIILFVLKLIQRLCFCTILWCVRDRII